MSSRDTAYPSVVVSMLSFGLIGHIGTFSVRVMQPLTITQSSISVVIDLLMLLLALLVALFVPPLLPGLDQQTEHLGEREKPFHCLFLAFLGFS